MLLFQVSPDLGVVMQTGGHCAGCKACHRPKSLLRVQILVLGIRVPWLPSRAAEHLYPQKGCARGLGSRDGKSQFVDFSTLVGLNVAVYCIYRSVCRVSGRHSVNSVVEGGHFCLCRRLGPYNIFWPRFWVPPLHLSHDTFKFTDILCR
jgi:hypothetical protein